MIALVHKEIHTLEDLDLMIATLQEMRRDYSPISIHDTVIIHRENPMNLGEFANQIKGKALTVLNIEDGIAHCGYCIVDSESVYVKVPLEILTKVIAE